MFNRPTPSSQEVRSGQFVGAISLEQWTLSQRLSAFVPLETHNKILKRTSAWSLQ